VLLYEACLERLHKKIQKLQAQNLEMETILESSHDGFVVADDRGILLRINDNYTKATGISREKIIGRSVYDEDMQKLFSPSGTALVLESRDTVTLTQRFAGGRQSIITSSPVRNEDGEIFRVVTNVRDMTEILKLREELDVTTSRLQESDQKLEELSKQLYICNEDAITTPTMDTLYKKAVKFAGVEAPLLITGASGVGKEVLANFVHLNSERSRAPFLKINCGAIPENLLETELFGHEEGAFTGARRRGRIGLFEAAAGGSILLDEIGELPLLLQVKLLRFVQHKEFFRVGGISPRTVDVRIIAATNKDLETMIEKGSFRVDLYYRLNILQLYIPPLAERRQDIIPLAHAFLKKFNAKHHAQKSIAPSLYNLLENHPWHGNVRELENLIERLVLVSPAREILPEHLPWTARRQEERAAAVQYPGHYRDALAQFEAGFWQAAIARYGSCRQAALHNGVDPSTVIKKAARLKLSKRNAEKEIQYLEHFNFKEMLIYSLEGTLLLCRGMAEVK
jgi:PAS domain S-box-containing protein